MPNAAAPSAAPATDTLATSLNEELSRVDAHVGDTLVGFAAFEVCDDGCRSFHHTEIFEEHSGRGHGKELAAGVMDIARGEGFTIVPTCPFLRKYMDQHPETQDLRGS
jgi:uncharacterized protein